MIPSESRIPTVKVTRLLPATCQQVFEAWTEVESVKQWMCAGDTVVAHAELDVRVGGRFRVMMRGPNMDYDHQGEYLEVVPPNRLVFTWVSLGTHGQSTLVTVELQEQGNQTLLTLTHERLPDREAASKHQNGWTSIVDKLQSHFTKLNA
ncbi:MAG TPA: SRPBCC domain-containing protein [Terriglobia bacterium]|nr:SRPBCC domain-containing protein [Terriglobia bacterium]